MENIGFSIGNIAILIRIPLENKIDILKDFIYEQNDVPSITWYLWTNLLEATQNYDYDTCLEELYRIKYECMDDLTKTDVSLLNSMFITKENNTIDKYQKLRIMSRDIQVEGNYQDDKERKPKAIARALTNTYSQLYREDSAIEDLLDEYYANHNPECGEITLSVDDIHNVADYAIQKMFTSFTFIKNYIKTWSNNDFHTISKTANQVLLKYKDTDMFDELCELIKETSYSWVYSSYHKQFIFLDGKIIGHSDSVLSFVANYLGYTKMEDIPYAEYSKCDGFIQTYIEIKGAKDERQSLGQFERK